MTRPQILQITKEDLEKSFDACAKNAVILYVKEQRDKEEAARQYPPLQGFAVTKEEAKYGLTLTYRDNANQVFYSDAEIVVDFDPQSGFFIFRTNNQLVDRTSAFSGIRERYYSTSNQRISVSDKLLLAYRIEEVR